MRPIEFSLEAEMQKNLYIVVSLLMLGAYLLSACSGTIPQPADSVGIPNVQVNDVVFTGVVEAIGDSQWTISGQPVSLDVSTVVDPNIQVGDIVKVEASVGQDGVVVAAKVEASSANDDNANSNPSNDNAGNTNDNTANSNDSQVDGNSNSANDNGNNDNVAGEIVGVVQAIAIDSITINGISYGLASFTEFNDVIAVGDPVKIHVIVNADGTFSIREIEKSIDPGADNSNANSNDNSNANDSDDGANGNSNDDGNNRNDNDDDDPGGGGNSNDDDDGNKGSNDNDD
jgi:hypothetical protein